jgi:large subunit ribosomal protein L3
MKFILGKKIEMTRVFFDDGTTLPVTKLKAGPCFVIQKKNSDGLDGYSAIKCAYWEKKKSNKPLSGIFRKNKSSNFQIMREFRAPAEDTMFEKINVGDKVTVDMFTVGDELKVTGTSKGKGFQGVVKRHKFSGGRASHGNKDQLRMPGSSGATGPKHVFKGKRRPGHMGDEQITIAGLQVVLVEPENNFIYVKGAVPGARNGLLQIVAKGDFEISKDLSPEIKAEVEVAVKELEKKEEVQLESSQNQEEIAKDK